MVEQRISSLLDPNLHTLHINKGSSVAPLPSGGLIRHVVLYFVEGAQQFIISVRFSQ
jgi:hypothetical protein